MWKLRYDTVTVAGIGIFIMPDRYIPVTKLNALLAGHTRPGAVYG